MFETMYHAEGVGLAAPQVGVSQRLFVVDVPERAEDGGEPVRHVHALVNPVIVSSSAETAKDTEGCLSIPGFEESVTRPAQVVSRHSRWTAPRCASRRTGCWPESCNTRPITWTASCSSTACRP